MNSHRIFLAPYVSQRPPAHVQRYWRAVHAAVFSRTPNLAAYRQNRPVEADWDHLGYVCSETWFTDREAEREAFGSEYYMSVVADDERRFTNRYAWQARVLADGDGTDGGGRYRVLGFGSDATRLPGDLAERTTRIGLDRPTLGDGPAHVLSLWTDDLDRARAAASALDGLAFVAEPTLVSETETDILHTGRLRLSYANCDPAGIVYYATYYPLFERVHTEWGWHSGMPCDEVPELWGVSIVARASCCEYFAPAVLHDLLRCDMRAARVGATSYTLSFDVVREPNEETVARGSLTLVCVDGQGKAAPVPASLRAVLSSPMT